MDVVTFGATKNGALGAEAVVFLTPGLDDGFLYLRKQSMQLASKGRFFAAQIVALLEGDLWRRTATHANTMATRLAAGVASLPGVTVTQAVQANAVFAILPPGHSRVAHGGLAVLRLGRGHRRGALDVLVGHDRG